MVSSMVPLRVQGRQSPVLFRSRAVDVAFIGGIEVLKQILESLGRYLLNLEKGRRTRASLRVRNRGWGFIHTSYFIF